jgi:hypothetical protein
MGRKSGSRLSGCSKKKMVKNGAWSACTAICGQGQQFRRVEHHGGCSGAKAFRVRMKVTQKRRCAASSPCVDGEKATHAHSVKIPPVR